MDFWAAAGSVDTDSCSLNFFERYPAKVVAIDSLAMWIVANIPLRTCGFNRSMQQIDQTSHHARSGRSTLGNVGGIGSGSMHVA